MNTLEFWRGTLTNSGLLAAVIVIAIAIIKTPLIKFKSKKWYRPFLTIVSLVLVGGFTVLAQLYVFNGALNTLEFYVLAATVLLTVLFSYNVVYEGLKVKDLVHLLWSKFVLLLQSNPTAKVSKLIKEYGLDVLAEEIAKLSTTATKTTETENNTSETVSGEINANGTTTVEIK